jgi:hypothetical protein
MNQRPLIVIQSGNGKFLGLTLPEWTLALFPYVFSWAFIEVGSMPFWLYTLVYLILIITYGQLVSKLEQDALKTFQKNYQLPNIVVGFFENIIPIDIDNEEEVENGTNS